MNEVTKAKNNGVAMLDSLMSGLTRVKASIPASFGGVPYMRLLKDGTWVVGAENTVLSKGIEVVLNPMSIQSGYSCWTNRKPNEGKNERLGEEMWGINEDKPHSTTLPTHHDPRTQDLCVWKDQMAADIKILEGKLKDQQVLYSTTSVGGINAMTDIFDAIMARLKEGSTFVCPILSVNSSFYDHKSYGRTYTPAFEIVGWMDLNGAEDEEFEPEAEAPAPEPEPAPTRRTRAAKAEPVVKAPEAEPEEVEPAADEPVAPTGRRRRT